jgi:uncharacterized protein (TIGR02444 family)
MDMANVVIVSSQMGRVADNSQQKRNAANEPAAGDGGLWPFALGFYARPGVAAALIALQDNAGVDVDLVLFAMWLGLSGGGRLDAPGLAAAAGAVRPIRTLVIEPLRALRRDLKSAADADVQRLRERIKALEVDAEKAALDRLAARFGRRDASRRDGALPLADAEANLARCLGRAAGTKPAALIRGELRGCAEEILSAAPRPARPSA